MYLTNVVCLWNNRSVGNFADFSLGVDSMARVAGTEIKTDLAIRVCVNGHTGDWGLNHKGRPVCKTCARAAVRAYRERTTGKPQTRAYKKRGPSAPVDTLDALLKRKAQLTKEISELLILISVEEFRREQLSKVEDAVAELRQREIFALRERTNLK